MISEYNYRRLLGLPSKSFFLFGPRGCGKTTWLRNQLPGAHTFDLLSEGKYQSLLANPGLFGEEVLAVPRDRWIVVDEVQRLPNLLNEVHRLIELDQRKFALCGSSARKLKRAGTNLLAGRATKKLMFPLLPQEMGADFSIDTAMEGGTLALIATAENVREALTDYVQLYLKEEIQAEAVVRNLAAFARFLPVAALFHGQVLNISSLARDAEAHRTTVNGYIEILEDTLIAYRLSAFTSKMRVREQQHPKFYFIDAGIVRALKKQWGPVGHEERGALFEGWVAGFLLAMREYRGLFDEWYYWAPTESRIEVDFLLQMGTSYAAIEVKSSTHVDNSDLKGLSAISGLGGLRRRIMVYLGKTARRTEDGIEILPLNDFIEATNRGLL